MNIKSLILGSATVALAATGAQAADAIIIAEPEPVEYVRVCDVYGAGYFYIPGTETCLRISGWVRHQLDSRVAADVTVDRNITRPSTARGPGIGPIRPVSRTKASSRTNLRERGIHQGTGAQINFDARSETEYGTLRGWVQLEGFNRDRTHAQDLDILINRALIQLGGLYMGYADSLFSSSSNIGGSGLGNYAGFSFADTFDYHYNQRHQIGYQFSADNGLWAAIGLEHNGTDARFAANGERWAPNVVAKVAYQQAWGGAWLAAAYDDEARGYGVKGGVQGNFGALTARLDASYRSKAGSTYGPRVNLTGPWRDGSVGEDARWGVQATALYQFTPQWGVAAGVGYYDNLVATGSSLYNTDTFLGIPIGTNTAVGGGYGTTINGVANNGSRQFVGGHAWTAQLGLNWTPVQNFQVGADVLYRKAEVKLTDNLGNTAKFKGDATTLRLRFQRNF